MILRRHFITGYIMNKIGFGEETQTKVPEVPQSKETPYPNTESIPVPTVAVSFYIPQKLASTSPEQNMAYPAKDDHRDEIDKSGLTIVPTGVSNAATKRQEGNKYQYGIIILGNSNSLCSSEPKNSEEKIPNYKQPNSLDFSCFMVMESKHQVEKLILSKGVKKERMGPPG
ncbi:hypothetical protein ACTXT7_012020 [Hymenolepis weldensis]